MAHRGTTVPWQRIVTIYVLVQFAEIFGVAMIYAYLPLALEGAGVPLRDIATLSGATTAGIFIVGAPQVPIWLAIAELRSRRLVIVRSGLIALVALVAFALAQDATQIRVEIESLPLRLSVRPVGTHAECPGRSRLQIAFSHDHYHLGSQA